MSNYSDDIRNDCVNIINKYLNDEIKSRIIEKSIYNEMITLSKDKKINRNWDNKYFKSLYLSKIRSLCVNINTDSYLQNKSFKLKILNDEIDIENISKLSPYDIFPENWEKLIQKKMEKDKLKYENKTEAMTDMFKCRKCGSRKCIYYEVQTRSADEPMTQFITCLTCKNNWKQ
jgi:transcription elongation factor S-II